MAQRLRSVPIQCSIDIAVPLTVAYEEWMKLEFLPEGVHTVRKISVGTGIGCGVASRA